MKPSLQLKKEFDSRNRRLNNLSVIAKSDANRKLSQSLDMSNHRFADYMSKV